MNAEELFDMDSMRHNRKDEVEMATVQKLMRVSGELLNIVELLAPRPDRAILSSALVSDQRLTAGQTLTADWCATRYSLVCGREAASNGPFGKWSQNRSNCGLLEAGCHYDDANKPARRMRRRNSRPP